MNYEFIFFKVHDKTFNANAITYVIRITAKTQTYKTRIDKQIYDYNSINITLYSIMIL